MDNGTLIEILKSGPMSFSPQEIQDIMDEELGKDPSEMDTELIDLCMDVLEKCFGETEQPIRKSKIKRFGKTLLIAAATAVLMGIIISGSASIARYNVSSAIVKVNRYDYDVDFRNAATSAKSYSDSEHPLIGLLQLLDFGNIILPSDLLDYNDLEDFDYYETEYCINVTIDAVYKSPEFKAHIIVSKYDESRDEEHYKVRKRLTEDYYQVEQIFVNGLDVLIFIGDEKSSIEYVDNNIYYYIALYDCDFDTAVKIVNSLE